MQTQIGTANPGVSVARAIALILAVLLIAAANAPPAVADVIVLTTEDYGPVLIDLTGSFEDTSGNPVTISTDTADAASARVGRGEQIDLVILPAPVIGALAKQGKVMADSVVPVAKSGIGVVVKKGAPLPDISTVDAFRRTMLAAPSFAYIDPESGGTGGIFIAKIFDQLGISDDIRRKAVLVPGGLVASRVEDGEAAIGLQRISELRAVSGVTLVGPLPAEIQDYTVYDAAIPASATNPGAGRALLARLRDEKVAPLLTRHGLERP